MSRREAWLSAGFVVALALAARALAAAQVAFPVPEDTAYYAGVARNLVEGRGLASDALWSYQTQPLTVPRSAFEVWLPLPSLLAAIPMAILGTAGWFRAAQLVPVIAGALGAGLAWRLGADVAAELQLPPGRARTLAAGAGVVSALLGPLVVFGALPDSTALFTLIVLAACLLITRLASAWASGASGRALDARLVALGLLFGAAALDRSEALWLGLAWLLVLWRGLPGPAPGASTVSRLRLAVLPAVVAAIVFAPWAVRDWLAFGTPLPGQAIGNALYTRGFDIFAWADPPTLARYLAQGAGPILEQHVAGFIHNLFNVLVVPAFPLGPLGILVLPRIWRLRSLRPLVLVAATTFLVTTLAFPVATQWGTFLHSAGPVFVLLVVSSLAALDAFIAAIGRIRRWTRPVAWLGPAFAIAAVLPLAAVSVSAMARESAATGATWEALPAAMAAAGVPLDEAGPVITNYPIWLAESARVPALALPDEPPEAVLDLARTFDATLVVIRLDPERSWPAVLESGGAAAACFLEVPLAASPPSGGPDDDPLARIRVYRIICR